MNIFVPLNDFEINGLHFRQKAMDPLKAAQLWPRIVALLAPALTALSGGDDTPKELKTSDELTADAEKLSGAIRNVCTGLGKEMDPFVQAFLDCTEIEYRVSVEGVETPAGRWMKPSLTRDFQRRHVDLLEWLVTCIRNEFADFLSGKWPDPVGGDGEPLRLPDWLRDEWCVWRLVLSSRASLTEIRTSWRYVDVVKANVVLNELEAAEARAAKAQMSRISDG